MRILNKHAFEYYDATHTYLVDGIEVPSITQMLKYKFGKKYDGINQTVLHKAAEAGTAVHNAIENYCRHGERADLPEVRNFEFLMEHYGFEVIANEVPVILEDPEENRIIAAGRLDLVLVENGKIGGADIKRTSTLDKEYLAYQLNLYRIAYRQTYGIEWQFLKGIHLREDTRKYVNLPIKEDKVWEFIHEWEKANEDTRQMDAGTLPVI